MVGLISITKPIHVPLPLHYSHPLTFSPKQIICLRSQMSSRMFSALTCLLAPSRYVPSHAGFTSLAKSRRSRISGFGSPASRLPAYSIPGKQSWLCGEARPRVTDAISGRGRVFSQAAKEAAGATVSSPTASPGFFCDFSHQIVDNPSNVSHRCSLTANSLNTIK